MLFYFTLNRFIFLAIEINPENDTVDIAFSYIHNLALLRDFIFRNVTSGNNILISK